MLSSFNGANDHLPIYPLQVFRVEPGTTHHIRTLSVAYCGCFTHYVKGASRYCSGDECRPDYHRAEKIWKGYASIEVYGQKENKWFPWVLEMTEGLELDFRGLYKRGQVWEIWREQQTTRKATPVKGKHTETRDPDTFPEAFDFVPVLKHLYHVERIDLSISNPLPQRVIVGPSEGDGPKALQPKPTPEKSKIASFAEEAHRRMNERRTTPTEKRVG